MLENAAPFLPAASAAQSGAGTEMGFGPLPGAHCSRPSATHTGLGTGGGGGVVLVWLFTLASVLFFLLFVFFWISACKDKVMGLSASQTVEIRANTQV